MSDFVRRKKLGTFHHNTGVDRLEECNRGSQSSEYVVATRFAIQGVTEHHHGAEVIIPLEDVPSVIAVLQADLREIDREKVLAAELSAVRKRHDSKA